MCDAEGRSRWGEGGGGWTAGVFGMVWRTIRYGTVAALVAVLGWYLWMVFHHDIQTPERWVMRLVTVGCWWLTVANVWPKTNRLGEDGGGVLRAGSLQHVAGGRPSSRQG